MRLGQVRVIGHDADVGWEDDPRQVSVVRSRLRQPLPRLGRMGAQAHWALGIGEEDRQGGAPGAGADDPDLVAHERILLVAYVRRGPFAGAASSGDPLSGAA